MKSFISIFIILFLASCVSDDTYQAVVNENNQLKTELNDIKFGAPSLLQNGKRFFDARDFEQAKNNLNLLVENHPNLPEASEAKEILKLIDEEKAWYDATNSEDISITSAYINAYPNGKYITLANKRNLELQAIKKQRDYNNAVSENKSSIWKRFIEDYPDFEELNKIKELIIKLEVDEIIANSNTGRMPSFDRSNYSTSRNSVSSVDIKNDTGCELIVRYSGPNIRMITIPVGQSEKVYLSSGSYKIAASACGNNYASTEELYSDYSSTFYIQTVRY